MKKAALLLALLGAFSLTAFAQDASTAPAEPTAASTVKHARKHAKKHAKRAAKKTAEDAAKTPAESTPATK